MEDCSTDERLQQETLCHRQWTDEYVEHPEMLMRRGKDGRVFQARAAATVVILCQLCSLFVMYGEVFVVVLYVC